MTAVKRERLVKKSSLIPSAQIELFVIAVKMKKSGLSDSFIVSAVQIALNLEGAADLMHLWMSEKDTAEREEIIVDIQDLIDASKQTEINAETYIKFNDLDAIAKDIRAFKDSLYQVVIARGGINKLAEITGIPQPSLSRFFNSNAMPRRSTVMCIAKALDLHEIKLEKRWCK